MVMRIVVESAGDDLSNRALEWAQRLADATGSELAVSTSGDGDTAERGEERAEALAVVAAEQRADLVVIGHRRGGTGADHRRSAWPRAVLDRVACPVAVIPADGATAAVNETDWVVAMGRAGSSDALNVLRRIVASPDDVVPVLAYDATADTFPHGPQASWSYPGESDARALLADCGIDQLHLEAGDEEEVLRRVAARCAHPVLVLGSRSAGGGQRGIGRTLSHHTPGHHGLGRADDGAMLDDPPAPLLVVPAGSVAPLTAPIFQQTDVVGVATTDGDKVALAASTGAALDAVARAERSGGESSRFHIEGSARPHDPLTVQRNDHANLAGAARPAVRGALLGAVALGAVLLVVCLVVGAGATVTTTLAVGGVIVGAVVGALFGLYSSIAMNRDVIDLRGQDRAEPVVVVETEPSAGRTGGREGGDIGPR